MLHCDARMMRGTTTTTCATTTTTTRAMRRAVMRAVRPHPCVGSGPGLSPCVVNHHHHHRVRALQTQRGGWWQKRSSSSDNDDTVRRFSSWRMSETGEGNDNSGGGYATSSTSRGSSGSPRSGFRTTGGRGRGRFAEDGKRAPTYDGFDDDDGSVAAYERRAMSEDARRRGRGGSSNGGNDGVRYDRRAARRESGAPPTITEKLVGELVYGTNPVREALRQNRRALYALYVQSDGGSASGGADGAGVRADAEILRLAEEKRVRVERASKHDLNMACDNKPHQGVLLDAEALEIPTLEDLPRWDGAGVPPVWLALDEIVDPQNLGAIIRSAHFLGVDGVVCCAKNSAPFNATVSKASAGAMEAQIVHQTGVMHRFLAKARDEGWDVVGAAAEEARAEVVSRFDVRAPTVLVMGNEGSGLRTNVRRACNRLIAIPGGPGVAAGVDSLNVSVAAGILAHSLLANRRRRDET
jgi:21S rRNA (GM2251-2'-O)-methyltransferase